MKFNTETGFNYPVLTIKNKRMKKFIDLKNGLTAEKKDVVFMDENKRFAYCDTSVKISNKKQLREHILNSDMLSEISFVVFKLKIYSIAQVYSM